jgi:hypothetical protein
MRSIWLALTVFVFLTRAGVSFCGETQPQIVVGTIVAMRPDEHRPAAFDLRVEDVNSKEIQATIGQTLTVAVGETQTGLWQAGLGDQVRVALQQSDGGWVLTAIERLGRGEFVNPGRNPSLGLGSPAAKVLVKFFAPLRADCHRKTADLLQAIAAQDPERVRVQIFDVTAPAAREEMTRERLTCATVLVNNRYEFTLRQGGRTRAVQLIHKPNEPESSYNSEDALAVVQQEIERLYPEAKQPGPAPGKSA